MKSVNQANHFIWGSVEKTMTFSNAGQNNANVMHFFESLFTNQYVLYFVRNLTGFFRG